MSAAAPARTADRASAYDPVIIALWSMGLDTIDIAKRLSKPEAYIANRLAALRDAGRAQRCNWSRS